MNLVDRLLAHPPDTLALVCGARLVTYGELADRAARWRTGLEQAGLGSGHRLAVLAGNDEVIVMAEVAALGAGIVVVPLNPQSPAAELARELAAVDPSAVLVSPAGESSWAELVGQQPAWAARRLDPANWVDLDGAPVCPVGPDAPAALLFTSGTAGMPQPAILTHGNLDASLRAMLTLPVDLLGVRHVGLAVIPLFHIFGLNAVVNLGLAIGATLVLDDYRSALQVAALVETHQVTILSGPPTMWQTLARHDELRPRQFRSVLLAVSGAAKLAPEIRVAVADRLGLAVSEGYGLTETCAVVATSVGWDAPAGSVGRLLPGVEVRLVDYREGDQAGNDVLVGDPGEVWVRGPMVSPGYFRLDAGPDDRRDVDGWLHTGDVAVVDDEGNLAIVDRVKDLIIVSGFNVYPGEVETVLRQRPEVALAAVVGEPHPATGEAVVAHVVPRVGHTIDVESLLLYCHQQLARYKVPRRVEIRQTLPQGLGGKLRRHELR